MFSQFTCKGEHNSIKFGQCPICGELIVAGEHVPDRENSQVS